MEHVPFPETADEPPYLLLWRVDDVAMPLLCVCIGMLLGRVIVLAPIGLVAMFFYRRFRDGRPEFIVLHALYWSGVFPSRGLGFINPYIRTLLP
jgi:conjugal transfer pilus assembly protein TraL